LKALLASLEVCRDDSSGKESAATRTVCGILGTKFFLNVFILSHNPVLQVLANGMEVYLLAAASGRKASPIR
jgi:hypothetical protein